MFELSVKYWFDKKMKLKKQIRFSKQIWQLNKSFREGEVVYKLQQVKIWTEFIDVNVSGGSLWKMKLKYCVNFFWLSWSRESQWCNQI